MLTFYSTLQKTYLLWKCLFKEVCLEQEFEDFYVFCSSDVVPVFHCRVAKASVSKWFFLFNGISRVMPVDVDCLVVL